MTEVGAGYDISADLVGIELGRSAVLDDAWDSYQWGKPPEGWKAMQTPELPQT
jgi:hypothetical protein